MAQLAVAIGIVGSKCQSFPGISRRVLATPEGALSEGSSHHASDGGANTSECPRVEIGTCVSNFFTVSKLAPLIVFILAGCTFILRRGTPVSFIPESHNTNAWLNSVLLIMFVYVGFEAALIPAGEARNPDRDAPIAILIALSLCTPLYALVQFVVVETLANPALSDRPLAAAAHVFGGPVLRAMIAVGVLVSVVGYFTAGMIATPRIVVVRLSASLHAD